MNYIEKTKEFAQKHNITLKVIGKPVYRKYFIGDKHSRYVFNLRLSRNGESYTFDFGQSIANESKAPELYDILECLQKYDVGSFENFCSDFGYDNDPISSLKTYKGVVKKYEAVQRLLGDILEELCDHLDNINNN